MSSFPALSVSTILAASLAGTPLLAQQAAPAPAARIATPAAPAQTAPLAVIPATPILPLPTLSDAQAAQLVAIITDGSVAHGLRRTPPKLAAGDHDALVRAALDYARAVHSGRLDTADFQSDWGLRPAAYDPLPAFSEAVKADRLAAWANTLAPPYAGYDGLQKGLAEYRKIDAAGGWTSIAAGPDMGLGATGPRVAALRKRLAVEDDQVSAAGDKFDASLQEAVKRAQRRYGLNPSGLVSTGTLAALNVSATDRVRQIMANMERWRWLPKELEQNRIQVNIAAAVVTVFDGDSPVMSMRGVTGKPGGGETPMLQSSIHSVVLNPPWNVPSGIAQRELFPKGAAYLKRNGFRVIGEGAGRRLQQQAGPQSALGRYKFDFDNPFAVYLHDTPAQAAFSRFDRLASHGCIRLEKPGELARLLLKDNPDWNAGQIDATVPGDSKTTRARLAKPYAVYLLYWTSYASGSGAMSFRGDPYGWDKVLAAKIENRSAAKATLAAR